MIKIYITLVIQILQCWCIGASTMIISSPWELRIVLLWQIHKLQMLLQLKEPLSEGWVAFLCRSHEYLHSSGSLRRHGAYFGRGTRPPWYLSFAYGDELHPEGRKLWGEGKRYWRIALWQATTHLTGQPLHHWVPILYKYILFFSYGHLTNQDNHFGPNGVHIREVACHKATVPQGFFRLRAYIFCVGKCFPPPYPPPAIHTMHAFKLM